METIYLDAPTILRTEELEIHFRYEISITNISGKLNKRNYKIVPQIYGKDLTPKQEKKLFKVSFLEVAAGIQECFIKLDNEKRKVNISLSDVIKDYATNKWVNIIVPWTDTLVDNFPTFDKFQTGKTYYFDSHFPVTLITDDTKPTPETVSHLFEFSGYGITTELLEKTINNPLYVQPYNVAVTPDNVNFNFVFSGEKVQSYNILFKSKQTGNIIFETGFVPIGTTTTPVPVEGLPIVTQNNNEQIGRLVNSIIAYGQEDYTLGKVNSGTQRDFIYNGENLNLSLFLSNINEYKKKLGNIKIQELGWSEENFESGKDYIWSLYLSQYSSTEAWSSPFYETFSYLFKISTLPVIKMNINNVENQYNETNLEINDYKINIKVNYHQTEDVAIKYYNFVLKDNNDKILDDTGKIYSGNIVYNYQGLLAGEQYFIEFTTVDNLGMTTFLRKPITVNYTSTVVLDSQLDVFELKNGAVGVTWKVKKDPNIKVTGFDLVRKALDGTEEVYLGKYGANDIKPVFDISDWINRWAGGGIVNSTPIVQPNENEYDIYALQDFSAKSNQSYIYTLYPICETGTANIVEKSITTEMEDYFVYPIYQYNSKFALTQEVWKFGLNTKEEAQTLNQDKSIYTTFSEYPQYAISDLNYSTGSITSLLGNIQVDGIYREPFETKDRWEKFLKTNSLALFKNPKGDTKLIFIDNNTTTSYMNEVSNRPVDTKKGYEEVTNRPTEISFNYTEIGKVNPSDFVIVEGE